MMRVVSNASPLIFLSKLGELELLAHCFAEISIPLDDLRARQKAKRIGLNMIGTLGVLQLAHAKGLIGRDKLLAHYDALVNQHGIWLSNKMLQQLKNG